MSQTVWADNGFTSQREMDDALSIVMVVAPRRALREGSVLDLGCRDGTLLHRLGERDSLARTCGFDEDSERILRGATRYPDVHLGVGKIDVLPLPELISAGFDMVVFSPESLLVVEGERECGRIRECLLWSSRLLVYTHTEDLKDLCDAVGLPVPPHIVRGHGGRTSAGLITHT